MRIAHIAIAIVLLCFAAGYANSIDAQGTASGRVILYFSGTSARGTFTSTFILTGQLMIDDVVTPFSASGWARGAGSGDTATLDLDAQATFSASGITQTGEAITVQGGLTLSGLTAGASDSSGSGTGEFIATVFIGDRIYRVQGDADGSASGGFVIPEDPYSMELAGEGIFHLAGELTPLDPAQQETSAPDAEDSAQQPDGQALASAIGELPWDTTTWPEELLAELLQILAHYSPVADEPEQASD